MINRQVRLAQRSGSNPSVHTDDVSSLVIETPDNAINGETLIWNAAEVKAKWGTAGGGGGGPTGTTRCDVWGFSQTNNVTSGSQSRPSDGFDISTLIGTGPGITVGGPTALTDVATDPTYGWSYGTSGTTGANEVWLVVTTAGWYDVRMFMELRYFTGAPETVRVGFNYPGQGSYNFPVWHVAIPPTSKWIYASVIGNYGPIYLPAAAAVHSYAVWSGNDHISASQFCLDFTKLS